MVELYKIWISCHVHILSGDSDIRHGCCDIYSSADSVPSEQKVVCLLACKFVPLLPSTSLTLLVAFAFSWIIPGGVQGLLFGRHVLFSDIFHSRKLNDLLEI